MSTEFTTVSSSSFDPAALAAKLTEKSAEGWTVVGIVSTGGDVTAFLSKDGASSTSSSSSSSSSFDTVSSTSTMNEPDPVPYEPAVTSSSEPAGWASAPSTSSPDPEPAYSSAPTTISSSESSYAPAPEPSYTPAPEPSYTPAPSVPAGWYADPAGRFELRYWDGGTWTEHVSRAGQQYTDPPVA